MSHVKISRITILNACLIFCVSARPALAQSPIAIPAGKVGDTFSYRIHIEGGTPPFRFKIASGTLPAGLTLDAETGVVSGTPSVPARQPYAFSVGIQDDSEPQQQIEQPFTVKIAPAPMHVVASPAPMRVVPPETSQDTMPPNSAERVAPPAAGAARPALVVDAPSGAPPAPQAAAPAAPPAATLLQIVSGDRQSGTVNNDIKDKIVVKALDKDNTAVPNIAITFTASDGVTTFKPATANTGADGTASTTVHLGGTTGKVTITAAAAGLSPIYFWVNATPEEPEVSGDLTRIVLGVEQVGASSANSVAKFFFDFYNDRPVGSNPGSMFGSPFRWWGDVRIGSIPVQTTAAISALTKSGGIVSQAGKLNLNDLAQAGEFQTGFAFNLPKTNTGPLSPIDHGDEYSVFSLFLGVGASLPFNPRSDITAFDLPPLMDSTGVINQGRMRFNTADLTKGYANTMATQVAFTTPDRNQFFRQYFGGVRLNTLYVEKDADGNTSRSVGTVSFSVGQNEAVSGGKLHGAVAEADAFFPLPISVAGRGYGGFYLFGRAMFQLTAAVQTTPLLLTPSNPQPTTFDKILIIPSPSRRDLYSIGIGIDGLRFARSLLAPKK